MEKSRLVKVVTVVAVIISAVFSLGGAFNVGETGFWMATPFMAFLIIFSFRSGQKYRKMFSIVFIAVCIAISMTLYKNPWVFPILQEGTQVEVLKDSFYRGFSDGSGSFIERKDVYPDRPTAEQKNQVDVFLEDNQMSSIQIRDEMFIPSALKTIHKLKAGQRFPVLGVHNSIGTNWKSRNYLVTALGHISEDEIQEGNIRIVPDLPIQSQWSKYLGNLMYWPVSVLLVQSYVRELADFNKHFPFMPH
ncbi:MAG: hypothetical protein IPK84_00830 [Candidatus Moraniibacteriota bacterium]|nr:MAG: hypothetical protein IPK84_00830 [Candidatus Moranbacteria bacterium]